MSKVILNDIINVISGGTPKTSESEYWENGTIGWLSINDFNNDLRKVYNSEKSITESGLLNSSTKLLKIDDIIISARGTVGVLAQIGKPMAFNQSCFGLRGKDNIVENNYLYYALKNYVANIKSRGQGSVFDTINLDSFKIMEIEIEDNLPIQQKIAAVLSALDDKIELNNKINAELEAMAKTLYDYWFVQFDFPNAAGKPYKSSGGEMEYNEVLKREIPKGWDVKKLGDLTSLLTRGVSPKYVSEDEGITVLNQKCVRNYRIVYEFHRKHDNLGKDVANKQLKKYDVLVNSTGVGTLGRVALVRWLIEDKVTVDSHVTILRSKPEIINPVYFGYSVLTKQVEIEDFANGSTGQVELNRMQLSDVKLIVPIKSLQESFSNFYNPIIEKTSINEQQNQELAQLRDWLLPMLMNGQVTVSYHAYHSNESTLNIAAEPIADYKAKKNSASQKTMSMNEKFENWVATQALAARGKIDKTTLREIFDAMDDEDK